MRIALIAIAVAAMSAVGRPAAAWGDVGHKVTALIAYKHLTSTAKARVDALLASDTDALTLPDFASRATWPDKYRLKHRETANWHFADIEIDQPDVSAACYAFPALTSGQPASAGPPDDCSIDKVAQFEAELGSQDISAAERILALKYLVHVLGDLHQPLHSSDHHDEGGNCIGLEPMVGGAKNLHSFWDTVAVKTLGASPEAIADKLDAETTAAQRRTWAKGSVRSWALQAFKMAKSDVYALPSRPTCAAKASVILAEGYQAQAAKDVDLQLRRAGVRIAVVLNRALK